MNIRIMPTTAQKVTTVKPPWGESIVVTSWDMDLAPFSATDQTQTAKTDAARNK